MPEQSMTPWSVLETAREWMDAGEFLTIQPVIPEFTIRTVDSNEYRARLNPPSNTADDRDPGPQDALTTDLNEIPYIRLECLDGPMTGQDARVCGLYVGETDVAFRSVGYYRNGPDELPGTIHDDAIVTALDVEEIERC